jgi:hypothetical protein
MALRGGEPFRYDASDACVGATTASPRGVDRGIA